MTLKDLVGTSWSGRGELWLDPLGNEAHTYDCKLAIRENVIEYHWSYDGAAHTGTLALRPGGADFTDTFHSRETMRFTTVADTRALVDLVGSYPAPEGPPWGWRIALSQRPTGELVLQMTNITPWGEDGRAVRMVYTRVN